MVQEDLDFSIRTLFCELEKVADSHDELTDTDVREALHMSLNRFFVWGKPLDRLPTSYGMFSREGDEAVARAVSNFLFSVNSIPELSVTQLGQSRLNRLQNPNIFTPNGCQYDYFIGHADEPLPPDELPEDLFDDGDYDE